jgi:UDP-N-acetylmuramate dehydrogenase
MNIPLCVKKNISLKEYNWFLLGGNAYYFAEPKDIIEYEHVIQFSKEQNMPIKILGLGANVLISDYGYQGIIIKFSNNNIYHNYINEDEGLITAGAGVTIEALIKYCLENALLFGLEEFSGIPSTVGGALFINLHYYEFLISQFVYSALVYDIQTKETIKVSQEWFEFGYDISKIKREKRYIILEASFLLKRNTIMYAQYAKGRSIEIIRHRENRYPYKRTCGCFFKNFSPEQVPLSLEGKRIVASSYYLDKVGVRGELKVNNTSVSSKHANMIIHNGKGLSSEVIEIAKIMQKKVYDAYSLLLEPECELIGFSEYPLYTIETIS